MEIGTDQAQEPDKAFERMGCLYGIEQAVQELPKFYRAIVRLHLLEGLNYQEIADILNQLIGTVKVYGQRGLAMLVVKQRHFKEIETVLQ